MKSTVEDLVKTVEVGDSLINMFSGSKVLSQQGQANVRGFLSGYSGKIKGCRLLYRGSEHGWTAADFHRLCDNRGPTMSLLKNDKSFVFGGFTKQPWDSSGGDKNDSESFIFAGN